MPYVLLTDSCCDMEKSMLERIRVAIASLSFTLDGKTYRDNLGVDMSPKDFYAKVRQGHMSVTSLVNVQGYLDLFTPYLEQGLDIVNIAFSAALSGSYQSSVQAAAELRAKYPKRSIYTIDSRCASLGQGLLVYMAAKKRDEGLDVHELAKWVEQNAGNICHWFTVDDLEHLYRGGRVSRTSAVVGALLKIKPVLHVDDEGALIPMEKVLGRKRAMSTLAQRIAERVGQSPATIFISHGDCAEEAAKVAAMIREKISVKEIYTHYVGPVVGAHAGPGVLAVFCYGGPR